MFPATSPSPSIPSTSSLNATQRRAYPFSQNGTHLANTVTKASPKVFIPKDQSFFFQISDQLLDLRRILANGQEDDLRFGLEKGMDRVEELVRLLEDSYRAFDGARLECSRVREELESVQVELDVTRSNLKMIEKNNEMLESAVRSLSNKHGTNPRDVGSVSWGRSTPTLTSIPASSSNVSLADTPSSPPIPSSTPAAISNSTSIPTPISTPSSTPAPPAQEPSSRFFHKFRFNSSSSSVSSASNTNSNVNSNSRPQTPIVGNDSPTIRHRSESHPGESVLAGTPSIAGGGDIPSPEGHTGSAGPDTSAEIEDLRRELNTLKSQLAHDNAELERHRSELELERTKRLKSDENLQKATKEKADLEAELESLSQALFEEANNMVSTERKARAESESKLQTQQEELREELREARAQREALRSALKVVESEMEVMRMGLHSGSVGGERSGSRMVDGARVGLGVEMGNEDAAERSLRPNAPRALDIPRPFEQSTSESLESNDEDTGEGVQGYSALPQTGSTLSTIPSAVVNLHSAHIKDSEALSSSSSLPSSSQPQPIDPSSSSSPSRPHSPLSHSSSSNHPSHPYTRSRSPSPSSRRSSSQHSRPRTPPLSRSRSSSQRGIKSLPSSRSSSTSSLKSKSISNLSQERSSQSIDSQQQQSSEAREASSTDSSDDAGPSEQFVQPAAYPGAVVDESVFAWSQT
ncbi:hypothetical protein EV360DRAFT_85516 [Lentinula raphanica]|nr:hypothetical protein EV360DRAFT_85516 [Lentinula raphanica]